MNITDKEWERFFSLRERVFTLIRKADEGYHKPYEGAVDVHLCFNNIYESKGVRDIDIVEIELHCYLLVDERHITWYGRTFEEAMDYFENWIETTEEGVQK